MGIGFVDTQ